jgi:hypothetical protein
MHEPAVNPHVNVIAFVRSGVGSETITLETGTELLAVTFIG